MAFAAHIREEDQKEQSVVEHCRGTAELALQYGKNIGIPKLGYLAGILHDIGKLTPRFDKYIRGDGCYHRGEIDHSYAGAKYFCQKCNEMGDKYNELAHFVARLIVSHHGLHDWIEEDGSDYLKKRIKKDEDFESVQNHIYEVISENELDNLIAEANAEYNQVIEKIKDLARCHEKKGTARAFYMGLFERLLESILIDADRTDTGEFMTQKILEQKYDTESLFERLSEKYDTHMTSKKQNMKNCSKSTETLCQVRDDISNRCKAFADHKVGVCQLIVPTGGGKTLSSLRFAIEYGKQHHMERIIYVAPFMSILEQNSDELRKIVGDENFLEHHSNMVQDIDSEEELKKYELLTEKWDSPVIATTMVQFLNTLFLGKSTSVRRFHRLEHTVIIIDEIQSLPLKCVNMFNMMMNFLKTICGSTIVLCSATQPDLTACQFPIIFDERSSMVGDYRNDFEMLKRTEVIPCIKTHGYSFDEAAEFCENCFQENGSLLIIVNTKKSALEMFDRLTKINDNQEEQVEIVHLSTNMCPEHRRDMLNHMRWLLKNDKKVICISTQLIEAGVDISFQCVVRFMAGMDNIAQAAGRCNRNAELDGVAPVYVINMNNQDENLGKLHEIEMAKGLTLQIFNNEQKSDYLGVESMTKYFKHLYALFCQEKKDSLSYITKDGEIDTTLVDLLSRNFLRWGIHRDTNLKWSAQAFKTAGSLFAVIDQNAVEVIVPYNEEAEEIILKLESDISMEETMECLRKAQKYTVSIYRNQQRKLEEKQALITFPCGALGLQKEYYNEKMGVTLEGAEMDLLLT